MEIARDIPLSNKNNKYELKIKRIIKNIILKE